MFSFILKKLLSRRSINWTPVGFISMMVFSLFTAFPVSAAPGTYAGMTLDERVKSYNYVQGLKWCFADNGWNNTTGFGTPFQGGGVGNLPWNDYRGREINPGSAESGDWFGTHGVWPSKTQDINVISGYVEDPSILEDGQKDQMKCNDIVKKATVLWSYNTPLELLCEFSNRLDGTCLDRNSSSIWRPDRGPSADRFLAAIKQKVYGGADITVEDEEMYYFANAAFFSPNGCNANRLINGKTPPPDSKDPSDIDAGVYRGVKTISEKTETKILYYKDGTDVSAKQRYDPSDPDVVTYSVISAMGAAGASMPRKSFEVKTIEELVDDYYGLGVQEGDERSVHGSNFRKSCEEIAGLMNTHYAAFYNYEDRNLANGGTISINNGSDKDVDCDANPEDASCGEYSSTCSIDGLGWIICPAMNFIAEMTDGVYEGIDGLLETQAGLYGSEDGNATYEAWKDMRDIANVGFVLAFLVVIFSQITSIGLSNYGVKKLLPKIIIVAILINISYFVAQLMVDISNILGASLKGVLEGQVQYTADGQGASDGTFLGAATGILAGTAALAAAGTVVYFAGVGIFIPVVLGALVAVVLVFLILVLRKALVVILIVLAPLAFLAMLLPNTKQWYSKWQKTFVTLLLVYPGIAILFGGSTLAASIVAQGEGTEFAVMGLAISTLPLFLVLPMLKSSLNAVPAIGNLAQKAFNKGTGGFGRSARERAKQGGTNALNAGRAKVLNTKGGGKFGGTARWAAGGRAKRASRNQGYASDVSRAEAGYVADQMANDSSIYRQAAAVSAKSKLANEELDSIETLLGAKPPETALAEGQAMLTEAIAKNDVVRARAANRFLAKSAPGRKMRDGVLTASDAKLSGDNYDTDLSRSLRSDILSSGTKGYNNAVNTWAFGGAPGANGEPTVTSLEAAAGINAMEGLQDREVASQDEHVLKEAEKNGHLDAAQAQKILSNDNIDLTPDKRKLFERIAGVSSSAGSIDIPHGSDSTAGGGTGSTFTGS